MYYHNPYAAARNPYGYYGADSRACVKKGSTGADVELLRVKMYEAGHLAASPYVVVDVGFDDELYDAVKAYQRAQGLGVDGVAGPLTWGALGETGADCPRSGGGGSRYSPASTGANGLGTYTEPFYKKTWFLWTVGGVTTAAVAALILWPKKEGK